MAKRKKGTKEELLAQALKLFAEKGYEAVTVAQIAQAVGVSAPAIYKHYSSKQALFEAILKTSDEGYKRQMEMLRMDFVKHPELKKEYISMTVDEQVERMKQLFLHTLHDEFPSAFRKLLTVEQYHMPRLAQIYNKRYIEDKYEENEALFLMLMEEGKMKKTDAKMLSLQYGAPLITLIGVCDREPDKEEWALEVLEQHVRHFNATYRI